MDGIQIERNPIPDIGPSPNLRGQCRAHHQRHPLNAPRRDTMRHDIKKTPHVDSDHGGGPERAAAATGTDGEQKLENNRTVPDAVMGK
jgi:hypothetical protein